MVIVNAPWILDPDPPAVAGVAGAGLRPRP